MYKVITKQQPQKEISLISGMSKVRPGGPIVGRRLGHKFNNTICGAPD